MQKNNQHPVLNDFHPAVADWFSVNFEKPSPAQIKAWPAIRNGNNTLLLAPTGSGKTLAAFLCAIDDLCRQEDLTDGIQVLYITPLKALGNDIHKNLLVPLEGIKKKVKGKLHNIRVAVRSGDTPQNEREKMIRKPPHILITTPESLYLLLGSKRIAPALKNIRTVIVDEVHAMCDSKRGVHLAVSLERLQSRIKHPIQRIGCSATIHPLKEIAAFLVGYEKSRRRPCKIIDAGMRKNLDIKVMAPLPDFLSASNTALWASAYELLVEEIKKHRTTLIFCNSRYKAERTALHLNDLAGENVRIGVHHGSMSKEKRLEMEDKLKDGELDALVATSSLELGIDVGSIDLVYQLESAKSVAAGTQRIGRAGHLLNMTSKGRFLIFERDELFEAAAICKLILKGKIDAIQLPKNCLDVLAQQIAGAVAAKNWSEDELFKIMRQAYSYHSLSRENFDGALEMLSGNFPIEMAWPPRALIYRDRVTGNLSATRSAKHTCAMCVGTIPDNSDYDVIIEKTRKRVGKVQSEFVDDSLRIGDIFVLGSSAWKILGKVKNKLLVEEAPGATPTVPWWTGPIAPRTPEVGSTVGQLRTLIADNLNNSKLQPKLMKEYLLGADAATAMIDYVREQVTATEMIPNHHQLLVETWIDELGQINFIIHCPLGRRLNKTWAVGIAEYAKNELKQSWNITATNDLILLTYSAEKKNWRKPATAEKLLSVPAEKIVKILENMQDDLSTGGSAFRETAACALQIRRAEKGRKIPMWLQNHRAQELFEVCGKKMEYPINKEIRRAYLEEILNIKGVKKFLEQLETGKIKLVFQTVESPSPFSHSLLIQDVYRSNHQMGRDRRAHLLRLHRKILQEILTSEQVAQLLDMRAIEKLEKRLLCQSEISKAKTSDELAHVIRTLGDVPASIDAVNAIVEGDAIRLLKPLINNYRVVAFSFPDNDDIPYHLISAENWRQYHDAFSWKNREKLKVFIPEIKKGNFSGFNDVDAASVISSKLLNKQPTEIAREKIVERYLKCHGPVTLYDLMNHTGWPVGAIEDILYELEKSGNVAKGVYDGEKPRPQWINKVNLEEIHRLTMRYLKRELAACAPYEVVDFMTRWQHRHPSTNLKGIDGLRKVITQLQGVEIVQGAIEKEMLAGRVADYKPEMLDKLISSGEVCWRCVNPDNIKRGKITLCLRSDMEWIASGKNLRIFSSDSYKRANVDIKDEVKIVRKYFKEKETAFFDDILKITKLNEDIVCRAIWHLVWCGELTCDTFECIRHANFQVTLSDCYDLANTSWKIVDKRIPAELAIKHIKNRKLDPRLGRWTATERLVPSGNIISEKEMIKKWAQLLLVRWGIVSRDIIDSEICSPSWGKLVPELKRLELLGKLSRGYFIEHHNGEQYGLPEAIELLRDCRARRSDGKELGYLPDEPIFSISGRDPANLYSYSLDIVEERGSILKRIQKRGNVLHSMLIQAGQVIIFGKSWDTQQLVTLDAKKLVSCIKLLKNGIIGTEEKLHIRHWNGHPIDLSPVSRLLWDCKFRFNGRNELCWPSVSRTLDRRMPGSKCEQLNKWQPPKKQKIYLPYYSEPSPVEYSEEWLISRISESLRKPLKNIIKMLRKELPFEFEFIFNQHGFSILYKGKRCIFPHIQKTKLNLIISATGWAPPMEVTPDTDVNSPKFISEFLRRLEDCKKIINKKIEKGKLVLPFYS